MACQKSCMDNKHISLVQNMQAQTINELSNKIFELETKLNSSEQANMLLRNENKLLKDNINTSSLRVQQLENSIVCNLNTLRKLNMYLNNK